ncbi:MAG: DUF3179 domain-containing (seleno)protein [Planctomycetota bacterium]|nr:DUF3179 domain-containing (seleno)protein [Planctomycetota bacterium]
MRLESARFEHRGDPSSSSDGHARAYSINMPTGPEIFNDVLGGKPIAVTW